MIVRVDSDTATVVCDIFDRPRGVGDPMEEEER